MILVRSNLVRHRDFEWDSRAKVGANIFDGRLMAPRPESDDERREIDRAIYNMNSTRGHLTRQKGIRKRLRFPFALFLVSHRMHEEAMHVFFSHNRFVLKGDLEETLRFLTKLPDRAIQSIKTLDLEISTEQLGSRNTLWPRIVDLIGNRCRLGRLWLSIDVDYSIQNLSNFRTDRERTLLPDVLLPEPCLRILDPLRRLRGLHRFHVFINVEKPWETIAEKQVMGPQYDSTAEGKLPFHLRSSCYPHISIPKGLLDDIELLMIKPPPDHKFGSSFDSTGPDSDSIPVNEPIFV